MTCGNCNREIGEETICPYCGFDNGPGITENQKKKSGIKPDKGNTGSSANTKLLLQMGLLIIITVVIIFGGMFLFSSMQGNSSGAGQGNQAAANAADSGETANRNTTAIQTVTVSDYKIFKADVSWEEAAELCYADGGYLAVITSEEEYDKICRLAEESGLSYVWAGASLNNCSTWEAPGCWITGEEWTFSKWYPGEPSYEDAEDGAKEAYLCLWKAKKDGKDIGWTMNDQRNDLIGAFSYVSGKVGYVCEYTSTQEVVVEQTKADTADPNAYVIADSNSRYITADELDKMTAEEIRLARNEIYARHGRRFQSEDLQNYFDSQPWYKGTIASDSFDESVLNEYEKTNARFMLEYEKEKGYR